MNGLHCCNIRCLSRCCCGEIKVHYADQSMAERVSVLTHVVRPACSSSESTKPTGQEQHTSYANGHLYCIVDPHYISVFFHTSLRHTRQFTRHQHSFVLTRHYLFHIYHLLLGRKKAHSYLPKATTPTTKMHCR